MKRIRRLKSSAGLGFVLLGLLSGVLVVAPATAASIQYSFTGQVDKVQNQLNPPFTVNSSSTAMSGFMTVNTSDLDTNPNNRFGEYTISSFNLHINNLNVAGYDATDGTFQQVEIRNGLPGQDQFNVAVIAPAGDPVGLRSPSLFEIQLRGPASVFSSDVLPTTSPSIRSFTNKNLWRLVFVPWSKEVSGVITSMTVVPLPAAVILFGAGLVALIGLGAGSWRMRKNSLA